MNKNLIIILGYILLHIAIVSLLVPEEDCSAAPFYITKGNRLYRNGYYSQALNNYKKTLSKKPNDPKAIFNAADSLYKMENYTTAIDYYRRALLKSKNKKLISNIHYNMGNSFYKLGEYKEAIKEFEKALDIVPYNKNVKQNLELAVEKLKNNKKSKSKNNSSEPKSSKKSSNKKKNNQNPVQNQNENESSTTSKEQEKTNKALTEEEAKKILQSLEEKNHYQLQKIIKNRLKKEAGNEKGW